MYKQRVTETAVYFVGGPFSQWFPSLFTGQLEASGPVLEFNCGEQYMMASKAHLMGDGDSLALIMDIVPEGGNAAFFALVNDPDPKVSGKAIRGFREVPTLQKAAGKQVKPFDHKLWDASCDDVVFRGSYYKFSQNGPLKATMMNTGDRLLVEGASYDRIWGVGLDYADPLIEDRANWRGQNKLGMAEMRTRDVFNVENSRPHTPRTVFNPFTMAFE